MYPSQQNATDQTANFFWLLCLFLGSLIVVWWLARHYIVVPIFWFRLHEINFILWASGEWAKLSQVLHLPAAHVTNLEHLQHFITTTNPNKVIFQHFATVNRYVGNIVRYPVAVLLTLMAGFVYFFHEGTRFRQVHSMKSLKKQERENWPVIEPVVSLDLINTDITEGPWAMAKLPLEYCRDHDLIYMAEEEGKKVWKVKTGPAYRNFSMQLGPLWRGSKNLPIHVKALLVIFIARAQRDRKVANDLIVQIAASANSGKLDFTGVNDLWKKYQKSNIIPWLEKRHDYLYTLMMSLLEIARTDGVLPSSEFIWLKPLDRRLWYVMNTVGRQVSFIEVAGVYSHWLAEKRIERPLKTPMVKEAVKALELAVTDILYIPEESRWQATTTSAA